MAYTIVDSRGNVVTTIGVATTTGSAYPIELIGESISPYGTIIAETQYHLLERFANDNPPANPVEGMDWYNSAEQVPYFRNANGFVPYATGSNSPSVLFPMSPNATALDFTALGSTVVVDAQSDGNIYFPTQIILIPNDVQDVSTPANFNLKVAVAEDVLETVSIVNGVSNKHVAFNIQGSTAFMGGTDSISVDVTMAGTATSMKYDVLVFGLIR